MNGVMGEIMERARQQYEAAEAHRAECTADPCARCERWQCRTGCGARVSSETSRCDACAAKQQRDRWAREATSQIPALFADAVLDAPWLVALIGAHHVAEARRALSAPRVVAVGPPGSGKTSLVAAMLAASDFPPARAGACWVSAHQLAKARTLHPLGEGEAPLIARALATTLLVVDELGGEDQRYASAVGEVLYERHAHARATWVTTGVGPAQIADRYGGGIARRVFEDAAVFRLAGRAR